VRIGRRRGGASSSFAWRSGQPNAVHGGYHKGSPSSSSAARGESCNITSICLYLMVRRLVALRNARVAAGGYARGRLRLLGVELLVVVAVGCGDRGSVRGRLWQA
jgi:hypothetical protein